MSEKVVLTRISSYEERLCCIGYGRWGSSVTQNCKLKIKQLTKDGSVSPHLATRIPQPRLLNVLNVSTYMSRCIYCLTTLISDL